MIARVLLMLALPASALAAPLTLYNPPGADLSGTTQAPCGDLNHPCSAPLTQSNQSQASLSWTAPPSPGWTYGGSVATGIGGGTGLRGPATAVEGSVWARSPDGQWTVGLGVSQQSFPGWGYGR